jgi:hypothetical protein
VKKKIIIMVCSALVMIFAIGVAISANPKNTGNKAEKIATVQSTTITIAPATVEPTTVKSTEVETTEKATEPNKEESVVVEKKETEKKEEPTVNNNSDDVSNNYLNYSEYELDLLARTIYQEAGICGEYCQWLVGSTVLNLADDRGGIENVVFDYNTFNVAYILYDCTPSDLSYSVARRVLSGDRDYAVKAFRTDYYHSFGTPYTNVDNVYFSTY